MDKKFRSAGEAIQVEFVVGSVGIVDSVDDDGDAKIIFPCLMGVRCCTRWVLKRDYKHLSVSQSSAGTARGCVPLTYVPDIQVEKEMAMPTS